MALVPMCVEPGELLTTCEHEEDVDYNQLWTVPDYPIDGVQLDYGDLMMVISCCDDYGLMPATLLHLRTNRLLFIDDVKSEGWLFRP